MEIDLKNESSLQRIMRINLPAGQVDARFEDRLSELKHKAMLPGFRKGRVPLAEIRRRYGARLRDEVVHEVIDKAVSKAFTEKSIELAGAPELDIELNSPGQPLRFSLRFEVFPEVVPVDFSTISLSLPVAEIKTADIDERIEMYRQRQARYEHQPGREAQEGDLLVVDMNVRIEGSERNTHEWRDIELLLGTDLVIPGLDEQLHGAGEDAVFDYGTTFPDDSPDKLLRGKRGQVHVRVREVKVPRLPEIDADFLQSFGIQEGGEQQLQDKIRAELEQEAGAIAAMHEKHRIFEELLALHELDVPECMLERQVEMLAARSADTERGDKVTKVDYRETAARQIKLHLIMRRIADVHDVKADADSIGHKVRELADRHEDPERFERLLYNDHQFMNNLKARVSEEKIVELISSAANVTRYPVTLAQLRKMPVETMTGQLVDAAGEAAG